LVDLINDGEAVRAATPNRPLGQLASRTQHLKGLLDVIAAGEALLMVDVLIDADVGDAVYYDSVSKTYKPALAALEPDPIGGWFNIASSSYVVGIVLSKTTATRGNLWTTGVFRNFDLTATIDGDSTIPGPYYLSTQKPGKLVLQKPAIAVYTLFNRGDNCAHLQPAPRDVLEDHIHYRFELFAQPAGTHNLMTITSDDVHRIITPDPDAAGWLPADHPIFNGAAPAEAKFGYNFSQHPELQKVFPPQPVESSYIERNGIGLPLGSTRPVARVDRNGIWWFDNCYGAAPWAPEFPGAILDIPPVDSSSSSSSSSSPTGPVFDCQTPLEYLPGHGESRLDEMTLFLWHSKMVFKTDKNVVLKLKPCEGSPIQVLSCDEGEPAETGELCLALDLNFQITENQAGFRALKEIDGETFRRGLIVEGLRGGANVAISGISEGGEPQYAFDAERDLWQGALVLDFIDPGSLFREGNFDLVAMDNIRQDMIRDDADDEGIFALLFPESRDSEVRGRIQLPNSGLPTGPKMRVILRLLSQLSDVVMPELEASFRRIPRNVDACTPLALPTADTVLSNIVPCDGQTIGLNEYVEAESEQFDVANGDTVFFTVRRKGTTDGYGGDLPALRFGYRIDVS
jgi:hypothetical protein